MELHYYGISNRNKNINPFKATYRLAWTSNIPRRGKLGLEVLGDEKPEDSAVEKTEIVTISKEVLATGIVLQRGKLTLPTIRKVKGQLLFMRYHQKIQDILQEQSQNNQDNDNEYDDDKSSNDPARKIDDEVQKEKEEGDADADADGVDLEEVEPRDVASGGSIGQRVNVRRRSTIRSSSGSRADKRRKTTSSTL